MFSLHFKAPLNPVSNQNAVGNELRHLLDEMKSIVYSAKQQQGNSNTPPPQQHQQQVRGP